MPYGFAFLSISSIMPKRNSAGFTIVELMIVVVIIGILAALVIPGYIKIRTFSQDKAVLNNLRQIAYASQTYMLEKGVPSVTVTHLYPDYLKEPQTVAGESYPVSIVLNDSEIEATNVGGSRTVVYRF